MPVGDNLAWPAGPTNDGGTIATHGVGVANAVQDPVTAQRRKRPPGG